MIGWSVSYVWLNHFFVETWICLEKNILLIHKVFHLQRFILWVSLSGCHSNFCESSETPTFLNLSRGTRNLILGQIGPIITTRKTSTFGNFEWFHITIHNYIPQVFENRIFEHIHCQWHYCRHLLGDSERRWALVSTSYSGWGKWFLTVNANSE